MAKENSEDDASCEEDAIDGKPHPPIITWSVTKHPLTVEELSSDEDHIDEEALKYMKTLKKKQQVSEWPLPTWYHKIIYYIMYLIMWCHVLINAQQVDNAAGKVQAASKGGGTDQEDELSDDDDDDDDDDDMSSLVRTSLEMEYATAIDSADTAVDEFYTFKSTLESWCLYVCLSVCLTLHIIMYCTRRCRDKNIIISNASCYMYICLENTPWVLYSWNRTSINKVLLCNIWDQVTFMISSTDCMCMDSLQWGWISSF